MAAAVLEKCAHSVLVGKGAQKFAKEQGFLVEENKELIRGQQDLQQQVQSKLQKTLCHMNISGGTFFTEIKSSYQVIINE